MASKRRWKIIRNKKMKAKSPKSYYLMEMISRLIGYKNAKRTQGTSTRIKIAFERAVTNRINENKI